MKGEIRIRLSNLNDSLYLLKHLLRNLFGPSYGPSAMVLKTRKVVVEITERAYVLFRLKHAHLRKRTIGNELKMQAMLKMLYTREARNFIIGMKEREDRGAERALGRLSGFEQEALPAEITEEDKKMLSFWDQMELEQSQTKGLFSQHKINDFKRKILLNDFILHGTLPYLFTNFLREDVKGNGLYTLSTFLYSVLDVVNAEIKELEA